MMETLARFTKKMPKVSTCCCGCSLGTGVIIISVLAIISGGFGAYSTSGITYLGRNVTVTDSNNFEHVIYVPSLYTKSAVGPLIGLSSISSGLSLVGGLCGIGGLCMALPTPVLAFFYSQLFGIVFGVISFVLTMSSLSDVDCESECATRGDEAKNCETVCSASKTFATATSVAGLFFGAILSLYFATVVASYFNYLKDYGTPGNQNPSRSAPAPATTVTVHNPAAAYVQPVQTIPYAQPVQPVQYAQPVQAVQYAQPVQPAQYAPPQPVDEAQAQQPAQQYAQHGAPEY